VGRAEPSHDDEDDRESLGVVNRRLFHERLRRRDHSTAIDAGGAERRRRLPCADRPPANGWLPLAVGDGRWTYHGQRRERQRGRREEDHGRGIRGCRRRQGPARWPTGSAPRRPGRRVPSAGMEESLCYEGLSPATAKPRSRIDGGLAGESSYTPYKLARRTSRARAQDARGGRHQVRSDTPRWRPIQVTMDADQEGQDRDVGRSKAWTSRSWVTRRETFTLASHARKGPCLEDGQSGQACSEFARGCGQA
jgi:hypothetical protein